MRVDGMTYRTNIFGKLTAAMEAGPEDLTATTDDMMRRASGSRADPGNFDPDRTSEETRQEDGANVERGAMSNDIDAINPDTGMEELPGMGGEGGDMGAGGGAMGGDPMAGGDPGMGGPPQESPEDAQRAIKLQRMMSYLYNTTNTTFETLSQYAMPAATERQRKIFNSAMSHLSKTRELLLTMLCTDIKPDNYPKLLKRYVALRHVYSTVLDMLSIHFDMNDEVVKQGITTFEKPKKS